MSVKKYHRCAECGAPILVSYSRYCASHMLRQVRYGSPTGRRLEPGELKPYRDIVARTLSARSDSKAVLAALDIAKEILNYKPTHQWNVQLSIQRQMQRLIDGGVTPHEFLMTVCSVFVMEQLEGNRFASMNEVNYQVARQALKLRSMHRFRPNATLLSWFGDLLRNGLAGFSYALAREAVKVDTKKEQRRNDMLSGWADPATPTTNP